MSQIKTISSEENVFCLKSNQSPQRRMIDFLFLSTKICITTFTHTHLLQAIVALRPAPAAETCVDPQTVANCVECKIVQIQNTLFQVFVL